MNLTPLDLAFLSATKGGKAPDQISGLRVWYAADAIVGLSDGDPVSTWEDGTALNVDFTAAGSNRPTYKTNVVNGKPVVRFDGTDDSMVATSGSVWTTEAEFFLVLKADNDPGVSNKNAPAGFGSSGTAPLYPDGSGDVWVDFASTTTHNAGPAGVALTSFRLLNVESRAGGFYVRVDTVEILADGSNTAAGEPTPLRIGGYGGTNFFDGDIAEIAVFDPHLSAPDKAALAAWFKAKYALAY